MPNPTPLTGHRYLWHITAAQEAASRNLALTASFFTWFDKLAASGQPITTKTSLAAEDLPVSGEARSRILAALNENPNGAKLEQLINDTANRFKTIEDRCRNLNDGKHIVVFKQERDVLERLNFAGAEIKATKSIKNDSDHLTNIQELKTFLLGYYHFINH